MLYFLNMYMFLWSTISIAYWQQLCRIRGHFKSLHQPRGVPLNYYVASNSLVPENQLMFLFNFSNETMYLGVEIVFLVCEIGKKICFVSFEQKY